MAGAMRRRHARYAWVSLFSVALVDLYIYLLAKGVIDATRAVSLTRPLVVRIVFI